MIDVDFGYIVRRSFEIAWKHKFLWLFGMFAAGSGFNFDFNYLMDTDDMQIFGTPQFDFNPAFLVPLFTFIGIFVLVMIIMGIISNGGLIDAVNRIERGGKYSFSMTFSAGLDYFFRILGQGIIIFLGAFGVIMVTVVIEVLLFKIHGALGGISLLIVIPAFIFFIFFLATIGNLAPRILVVRNNGIIESLEEAFYLFKTYLGKCVLMALLFMGLNILFGIGFMIIWAMFGIPIGMLIYATSFSKVAAFIAAALIGLPISLVIGGITGVFNSSAYTLFYFQLVEPKQQAVQSPPPQSPPPDQSHNSPLGNG